jgi:DNA-binding PadR family transcriptional regulator
MAETKPNDPLLTYEGYRVAEELMSDINGQHTGYAISRRTGVKQGTLYPLLQRWADAGWLSIREETPTEHAQRAGRKGGPRKLITVTARGQEKIPDYWRRWQEKRG